MISRPIIHYDRLKLQTQAQLGLLIVNNIGLFSMSRCYRIV